MDATYKTCKLALPLFLLVVKTNVGFQCVATFVVQVEDIVSLKEALQKLKEYLVEHDVRIGSFMVDCSSAEIGALWEVFPGMCICITEVMCFTFTVPCLHPICIPFLMQSVRCTCASFTGSRHGCVG